MLTVCLCQVFDYQGKFLRKFGSQGSKDGQLSYPFGLAVDSARNWLVADHDNHRISVFRSDGSFLTTFTYTPFSNPYALTLPKGSPYSLDVDHDGRVIVGDSESCVYVFVFEQQTEKEKAARPMSAHPERVIGLL